MTSNDAVVEVKPETTSDETASPKDIPTQEIPQEGVPQPLIPSAIWQGYVPGVPLGLETLVGMPTFYINQEIEWGEVLLDYEMNNRYFVFNQWGHRIFFVGENTGCFDRVCLGVARGFTLHFFDPFGQNAMDVTRVFSCFTWCCGSCAGSNITVIIPSTGEVLGRLEQVCRTTPDFNVFDGNGTLMLKIEGDRNICCMGPCCEAGFRIKDPKTGTEVGQIMKRIVIKEQISDANSFGIVVQPDLDTRLKAVLLGAVFCIDFAFFERSGNNRGMAVGIRLIMHLGAFFLILIAFYAYIYPMH